MTPEHNCSYIEGQQARSLFLDPAVDVDGALYSQLNRNGFRRSGKYVYKSHCESCNACLSCRVDVHNFKPSRSQKRVQKRNQHLIVKPLGSPEDPEAYDLYSRYINERHNDGDMYPATPEQYDSFLVKQLETTAFIGFYEDQRLVCVAVIDYVQDGLSALYTFYDPNMTKNALGVNAILWQIEACKKRDDAYLYLGYWIAACDKMNYKTAYQPLQILQNRHWIGQELLKTDE